ncbi:MAG TPA: transglutaminase domain-containing protein, partial [Pirellulales bacterium]|nr:transglutaminase domain-containing protein [Pirellulales bacterium]
ESGVTFASASQLPDQNGQQLAWSLGTIQPYDRASVTLTVTLGAGLLNPTPPTTPQLDTGASAYGTLDAGMVTWTTAPASLRTTAIAANLLASTPDANTTDPYVQEKAAELNYDPTQIYNFLHTQIGYNSYLGSVRGARGTLWSNAGNALDDASLGVALMRASGIPAQYELGTLSQSQAQQLILSMFPASYQTVGYIPAGSQTSDPADDPTLLSETEQHYWFQFDSGSGMQDADPLVTGTVGQAVTASTGTFSEVPDNLREKTEVSLTAEIYSQAAAALTGGSGLSQTVVLDQTFNDVDLVGKPLTVGNFVTSAGVGAAFSSTTNTYSPYIKIGDDANGDPSNDQIILGTDYQEVYTTFPLGSQILSGLFMNVTLSGPEGASQTYDKTLFDRIGYAARQIGTSVQVSASPSSGPSLSPFDIWTLNIGSGLENPTVATSDEEAIKSDYEAAGAAAAANDSAAFTSALARALTGQTRAYVAALDATSDDTTSVLADGSLVTAYFDRPRITVMSSNLQANGSDALTLSFEADLLRDSPRIVGYPGQGTSAPAPFLATRGIFENLDETAVFPQASAVAGIRLSPTVSAVTVFAAAQAQGIPVVTIAAGDTSELDELNIDPNAKARIASAVERGQDVLVPAADVILGGKPTVAWLQIDSTSGDTVGVNEDGSHGSEEPLVVEAIGSLIIGIVSFGVQYLAGQDAASTVFTGLSEKALLISDEALGINIADDVARRYLVVLKTLVDKAKTFFYSKSGSAPEDLGFDNMIDELYQWAVERPFDPPLPPLLLNGSAPTSPHNLGSDIVAATGRGARGDTAGQSTARRVVVAGQLQLSWVSSSTDSAFADFLAAGSATVMDQHGTSVGTGKVALSSAGAPLSLAIAGAKTSMLVGTGSVSFYGPAQSSLGASGDWGNYSASLSGNASISVTAPADALTLNGQALPAGTYTITTSSATFSGSGATTSPNFAGSVSITAMDGTVQLGPGSGGLSVGGAAVNTANETTLAGYNGTVSVSANGNGADAVTLSGGAANALTLAPSPATLTTDQTTPVSFNTGVNTSFADTYNLTASAPSGWSVTVDDTGKVTVTPAPGTQSGTFPIQVIAQSTTNPYLISQSTVEVTVTSTMPGMTFAVNPDPVFTVPFDNAQVPSAFRATILNMGPTPDTYNLTFSNVPAGWTIVDSGTSDMAPAGQTGIVGIYLEPTGNSLPAPGTQVSFTVTATSTADSSITKTVTVTFTMPAIAAATVTSDPVELSTTPGAATTAAITITNVGNVPYNAALATTTDSGLAISGLSSPGMIAVGQSVTETATLTPDASTPLNTTLNATVNVDQAATQNGVSVVEVNASTAGAVVPQNGTGQEAHPPGFAVAGQSVDVTADVQSEVSQSEQGEVSFTVTDAQGNTVFTSTAVPITLDTIGALTTVDLGTFNTTGFAPGEYTINVSIAQSGSPPVPIAGATGSTTLTVGLPVSASVSVDTDNQTPGAVTSTETLNVTSNAVMGNVAIDSTATSVAVNPGALGLAYVAGTQDISVVDISNPSTPKVLGTFGSKDLNLAGQTAFNLLGVAGNELIVASQAPTATTINVLVYSLANPQAPTLLGTASVPYDYLNGMTIEGTTAYLSTYGQTYDANGDVLSQTGELVAVDFSKPAMPVIGGALYNDLPQPAGHASFVFQSAVVNPQTLLVTGSTSTGASTQTGTGTVTMVNTGAGGTLSTGATLTIPATVDAVGIAIDGTHALVVGSTGGLVSPFSDPSQVGLSGNVTLTLLDITNPASPTVIGSTVITQNTFQPVGQFPLSALNVIALGNGQFAINGTLSNGSPTILCVDASNPTSLATSNLPTNASAAGLTLAGGQLFGAAADGLTIYQAAALTTTPTTVTVTVPTNGVSIVPNSFSLAPTSTSNGTNSETLTWTLNLAPGANQQITWQTNVADLQAEQVQPVVTAATVEFTSPGSPPRSVGATLGGATLNLAGVPTPISVTIPVEVAAPGVPAIENAAVAAQNLNIPGLPQQLNDLGLALTNLVETPASNVYLSQALAALASLITLVTNDPFLSGYAAGLTTAQTELSTATTPTQIQTAITNLGTALDSLAQAITDYALHGFTLSLASNQALALPGAPTLYNVVLQNTGSQTTTYDFSVSGLPAGVTATFSPTSITLAPGASIPQGTTTVTLSLSQSGSSLVGGNFTVTATAEGASEITLNTPGQLTLLAESLTVPVVTVTPPFTQPGGMVDVTAKIETVVNEPHTLSASFTVSDPNGNVIYTDANPQTVPLTDTSGLTTA